MTMVYCVFIGHCDPCLIAIYDNKSLAELMCKNGEYIVEHHLIKGLDIVNEIKEFDQSEK